MAIEMVNPGSARSKLGCLKSFSRNMEKQIASYFHAGNISVLGGKSPALGEILARHCWMKDLQIWSSSRFELQRSLRESNGWEILRWFSHWNAHRPIGDLPAMFALKTAPSVWNARHVLEERWRVSSQGLGASGFGTQNGWKVPISDGQILHKGQFWYMYTFYIYIYNIYKI